MRISKLTRFLLAVLLLAAGPALSQTIPMDLELGYRFVNVAGNEGMYRSQINEREGFLLRSFTLSAGNGADAGFFDKLRIDVSDIGAGPAGSAKLEIGKSGIYQFKFSYARWQMFSALPAFANPLLNQGIIPGQHTWETLRNVYDAELRILPGAVFTPILGYTYNLYSGPSTSTVYMGGDEFRLNQSFRTYDEEPRIGFDLNAGPVAVYFMQGWRVSRGWDTSVLTPGAGAGNNSTAFLGQQLSAISYTRTAETNINVPVTTASAVVQLGCFGKILGTYARANAGTESSGYEAGDGNWASTALATFFGGLNSTYTSNVTAKNWRGSARAELTLAPKLEVFGGWMEKSREQTGFELLSTVLYNTRNYAGASTPNISQILNITNGLERTDEVFDLGAIYRQAGPFGLRFTYSHTKQDVTVSESVAEIVVPGGQSGEYNRSINTYDAGMTFSLAGVVLDAEYRGDQADQAILRTDFTSRSTWRARLTFSTLKYLRISGTGQWTWQSNNQPGIDSNGKYQQYGGDIDILPISALTLRFSGNAFWSNSFIPILTPQNMLVVPSTMVEHGYSLEGGLSLNLKLLTLQASGGEFKNTGSMDFKIDRFRGTLEVPIIKAFSLVAEWAYDKYTETVYTYGDYSASRVGLFAHWKAF
ncbi:MAG TPA: hypothetical protein PLB02_03855 [Thermoanaerobaculia bacterium]|nr:hypothetical protein [Thermoanaerobaculia bacterium]HQR66507.1 hypothetical protein [Thermoanaerobaculia bacterium]